MSFLKSTLSLLSNFPFDSIKDQQIENSRNQAIPPNVYQTWESNRFGKRHAESINSFRRKNLDLNFRLFDRSARDKYMRDCWGDRLVSEIYFRSQFGALRADIFRYCLIYDLGGYYFDISKGIDGSLTSLHSQDSIGLITFEQNKFHGPVGPPNLTLRHLLVAQWGFGFVAKSNLLKQQIERLEETYESYLGKVFANPKSAILEFSGPISFTKTVHQYAKIQSLEKICQAGIDFQGSGIFALRGSESRYLVARGYASARNRPILI